MGPGHPGFEGAVDLSEGEGVSSLSWAIGPVKGMAITMTESSIDVGLEDTEDAPEVTGSEAAFHKYIAEARALPASALRSYPGSVSLIHHNVARGVAAVLAERATVAALPGIDIARIERLPNLALGLAYAAAIALREAPAASTAATQPLQRRAAPLRRMMLAALEACAEVGLIPTAEVTPIRSGRGAFDQLGDLAALVALFRKHAPALENKTPVTAEHLREASELAATLQTLLRPHDAAKDPVKRSAEGIEDDRNRLYALLSEDYATLCRAAGFLWGAAASDHVPALLSRARSAKAESKPAEAPAAETES